MDVRRLGKQRVEAKQIYNTLGGLSSGWRNHPAVHMWETYQNALAIYHNLCLIEWTLRGYVNNMHPLLHTANPEMPPWFGDVNFHRSHQSNLVRKKPEHYRQYFPEVPDDLPYVWPKGAMDDKRRMSSM